MPKQKTDDLLQLIQSLTRAEKRHFRLFVKRNQASEDILFLQLFDFLDKHKEYDEEKVLRRLPAIKKRQLSNLKAHLYKQLLVSLRLINKNYDINIEIREVIDYARVLYNKGLYRQSLEILAKAKSKAIQTERNVLLLEILQVEKHIETQYITGSIETRADELSKELTTVQDRLTNVNLFSDLALQIYGLYLKTAFVHNEKDYLFVHEFFYSKLPVYKLEELSFFERIHLFRAYIWYYHMTQNFLQSYKYAERLHQVFMEREEMIPIEAPLYLKSLHNLLNTLFHLWHYDKFLEVFSELEVFKDRFNIKEIHNIEGLYYLYLYIHKINKHYIEGTYEEGLQLVPPLMQIIEQQRYNWDERREMLFYYKIACLYFGNDQYEAAIDYFNRIINQRNPDYRQDIQCFARILNLIAHFELGNQRLVEYQIKSVYRFLAKMSELHEVQRAIFRFLRKTPKMRTSQLRNEFIHLKGKLELVKEKRYERRPFLYLDIISWLESKIEDRPLKEIVHQKFLDRKSR